MVEFDVIGTDQEVDTSDPVGSLMSIGTVIAGLAVLFMAMPIGRQLGSRINTLIANLTGADVGDADTTGTGGGGL